MAWIESHQSLRGHPKVLVFRLALSVSEVTAIGHLHFLWWWALDNAPDGDLSIFAPAVIAHGAGWDGDADVFFAALKTSPAAGKSGFVDADGRLHQWQDYAGKLLDKREADRRRKAESRAGGLAQRRKDAKGKDGDGAETSTGHPADSLRNDTNKDLIQSPSGGRPADGAPTAQVTVQYRTVPTEKLTTSAAAPSIQKSESRNGPSTSSGQAGDNGHGHAGGLHPVVSQGHAAGNAAAGAGAGVHPPAGQAARARLETPAPAALSAPAVAVAVAVNPKPETRNPKPCAVGADWQNWTYTAEALRKFGVAERVIRELLKCARLDAERADKRAAPEFLWDLLAVAFSGEDRRKGGTAVNLVAYCRAWWNGVFESGESPYRLHPRFQKLGRAAFESAQAELSTSPPEELRKLFTRLVESWVADKAPAAGPVAGVAR